MKVLLIEDHEDTALLSIAVSKPWDIPSPELTR